MCVRNWTPVLALAFGAVVAACPCPAAANLITVDWDNTDNTPDGNIVGTLGGADVSVVNNSLMTSSARNGGRFFSTNWAVNMCSDGVPGINDPGVLAEGATLDMGGGGFATTTVTFSNTVSDPILLFNFLDNRAHEFLFNQFMPQITTVDWHRTLPGYSGNDIQINFGEGDNTADSGFSIQLYGDFDDIAFDLSGVNFLEAHSIGFTVATAASAVPEPSVPVLIGISLVACRLRRRRQEGTC